MKLQEQNLKATEKMVNEIIKSKKENESVRDLLARIYLENLPDKTIEQGYLMGDEILKTVENYNKECKEALENFDAWQDKFINQIIENKTLEETCQILYQMTKSFTKINAECTGEEFPKTENTKLKPEECTEELKAELIAELKTAIDNCGLGIKMFEKLSESIGELSDLSEFATYVKENAESDTEYKSLCAMITYINIKNGNFEGVPNETNISDVTLSVCATVDQQNVANDVAEGKIEANVGAIIIKIIGAVVGVIAAAAVFMSIFPTVAIYSALIGLIVGGIVATGAIACAVGSLIYIACSAISKPVSGFIKATGSLIIKGVKKVWEVITTVVIPATVSFVTKGIDFIKNLFTKNVTQEETETVTVNA